MSDITKQDLWDLKRDLSELFDAKLAGVDRLLKLHETDIDRNTQAIAALQTAEAVSASKLKAISAAISLGVSGAALALQKILKF